MNEQSQIEINVMQRVHRISKLRVLISGGVFALTLALLALYAIGREVWVARVFENGPQTFSGHALYLLYAFLISSRNVEIENFAGGSPSMTTRSLTRLCIAASARFSSWSPRMLSNARLMMSISFNAVFTSEG